MDAGADAGKVVVFDQTGSIALAEEQSFQTARLGIGTYDFTSVVAGQADVYVRKGFAPTTKTYDCKISTPQDACPMAVSSSAILYVLVHGQTTTATFHVVAQEE